MDTAAVEGVHIQPLAQLQEGDTAEFSVRVTLASAVVGDIVRDHTMRLAYEGGRWGVVWDEGLILPELAGGNRLALELRIPSRGNIYDRDGQALAYQGTAYELGAVSYTHLDVYKRQPFRMPVSDPARRASRSCRP